MSAETFVPWLSSDGWIIAANGCHLWTGERNRGGYGVVRDNGRTRAVHRVRYEREIGPIPEGLQLDHFACDNPACCNPSHCRPVTARENTLRGNSAAAWAVAKTHCLRGHPLSGDNLMPWDLAQGYRRCRICRNARSRKRRRALYAASAEYREKSAAKVKAWRANKKHPQ